MTHRITEATVSSLYDERPRPELRTVKWASPAQPGDPVFFNALNDTHGASPGCGEHMPGWRFVRFAEGTTAVIRKDG